MICVLFISASVLVSFLAGLLVGVLKPEKLNCCKCGKTWESHCNFCRECESGYYTELTCKEAEELFEMLNHWAAYASEYFKNKWNLDDDLKRARELLRLDKK